MIADGRGAGVPIAPASAETLRERLRRGILSPLEALRIAGPVLEALRDAHARGVIHGAVNPATIVLQEDGALLIDFGAAASAVYLSPEQSGLIAQGVDARSDLYSLGVTLFEALAGAPPFPQASISELQRAHLTQPPPKLHAPRATEEAIGRLLRKHPRDRPASAAEALEDFAAAEALLERGERFAPLPARAGHARLGEPRFIGREEELAALAAHLSQAAEGRVAAIESEPGGGKTRLLDELAHAGHERGALVIRARGALGAIADPVAAACRNDAQLGPSLAQRLGEDRGAVAAVFPELPLGAPDAAGPEEHAQGRAHRAAPALLSALGTKQRPVLVLIDDFEGPAPAGAPHALVVIARLPAASSAGLDAALLLAPLSAIEQRAMAESMAGPLPEAALEAITQRSSGNPLLVEETLRTMVESGALVAGQDGFAVDAGALASLPLPRDLGVLFARRLQLLPAAALRLLSGGAMLGTTFSLSLAASLAGQSAAEALLALDECRRRQLVIADAAGEQCNFAHGRVREEILERITPGERRRLHLEAAAHPLPDGALAEHLAAAAEHARAFPHALAAADAARARFDFDAALRFLKLAEPGAEGAEESVRSRLFEQQAAVLAVRGRFAEAEAALDRALPLLHAPLDRARLQGRMRPRGLFARARGSASAPRPPDSALCAAGGRARDRAPGIHAQERGERIRSPGRGAARPAHLALVFPARSGLHALDPSARAVARRAHGRLSRAGASLGESRHRARAAPLVFARARPCRPRGFGGSAHR